MSGAGDQSAASFEAAYQQTRFRNAAREYGWRNLILTWSLGSAAVLSAAAVAFYWWRSPGSDAVVAVSASYIALAGALFGIVLAGLAVVAAFFDPTYIKALHNAERLRRSLFAFWWVAALTVLALVAAVGVQFTVASIHSRGVVGTELAVATFLFLLAMFEALSLVGTVMRHGLWRARVLLAGDNGPPGPGSPPTAGT